MDFKTPKHWEFALLNNYYQISKNERNQHLPGSSKNWLLHAWQGSELVSDIDADNNRN